ncbi:hypothetical protein EX895_003578 [Sporisorium graminicola]|uniref:AB hydrolase-1 domain-containing protein n=1 Tax=Sporisorium graminicola TaxID=280036 RepID=A0A4U7KSS9_9BASI|nr:hypothetical protein EX895_003578 [Sporisorium graminicola]TKY87564.1 hypothetical protein EX895_003578 [Sporisorium graminicola]
MAYPPISSEFIPCQDDSSVSLTKAHGARTDRLRWHSQGTGGQVELPVYVDEWLDPNACASIEQVVVHVHGKERDGNVAWADIAAARSRLPIGQQSTTLVVVPQFLNGLDITKMHSSNQHGQLLVWKSNGWGEGSASVRPRPLALDQGVSSFEALDAIVCHYANQHIYTSIKRIVVSGHSMGGQLVHRYSVLGSPPLSPQQRLVLKLEYVVMNPASFLYFEPDRIGPPAAVGPTSRGKTKGGRAEILTVSVQHQNANNYKYGFEKLDVKLPTYRGVQESTDVQFYLKRMLSERCVAFLHGEADRGVGDDRPEALAQGATRYERAINYHRHLEQMQSKTDVKGGRLWTVDWVAKVKHDGRAMTTSDAAIARIFQPR